MQAIEMIPSARRLIKSLRDMGYDFAQAVADVVDNSIEAKATVVAIDVVFDGDDSWLRISDNGVGMSPEQLREAMRYGSDRDYNEDDLGKFGLGLKTASMSQCQCLSVASRWNPDRADIAAYSWDLTHIERTNRWEVLPADKTRLPITQPLRETTGTVVLWQRLDRVLGYKHPYGEFARKRLSTMCREIEQHLGMVFHKFINGEIPRKRLKILLNDNEVKPWDPFCRAEPKTRALQPLIFPVEQDGSRGEVMFQPYILPHQDDFSTADAFRAASGPANWNQQQGFYIYRAGRMIQSGGWSHLRAPDEHTKLVRIAVDFSPKLDEAFKINVAKMRAQMPAVIRDDVRKAIIPVVKIAQETYRRKTPITPSTGPSPNSLPPTSPPGAAAAPTDAASPPSSPIAVPRSTLSGPTADTNPIAYRNPKASEEALLTFAQWAELFLAAAGKNELPVIQAVLNRCGYIPSLNGLKK